MTSHTSLPNSQGFRTCFSPNIKDIQDREHPGHFTRFTYRLLTFNTLQCFYLPQEQNNILQLEGTREQSISVCPDRITFPQTKNNILTRPNISNTYPSLNPFYNSNKSVFKREQFKVNYNYENKVDSVNYQNNVKIEKKHPISNSNEFSTTNEYKSKETQLSNKRCCNQNIKEESSNILQKCQMQSISNLLNQQSNHMNNHNQKRSNPYYNEYFDQSDRYQSRNKKRNHFSINRLEITSRYQCPEDVSHNENKQISTYLQHMQGEIKGSLQGQDVELFVKKWIMHNPKQELEQKSPLPYMHQPYKQVKGPRETMRYEIKKQKQEQLCADPPQKDNNLICVPHLAESQQNRLPTYDAIFNYPGHDSAFQHQDEQQLFEFNEFLLN